MQLSTTESEPQRGPRDSAVDNSTLRANTTVKFFFFMSFQAGEFHLNDSLRHRHLSDELVPEGELAAVLAEMNIPFLQKSVKLQLKALESELHR